MGYIEINGSQFDIYRDVVHRPMPRKRSGFSLRKSPPDLGVIHYTGAENPAETVFSTLLARGLSVHFVIDRDGVIYQWADPGLWRCSHAGKRANNRSVGIEVVCYGNALRRKRNPDPDRPTYEGEVHGWNSTWADFYPEQYDALDALTSLISSELPIDLEIPSIEDRRFSDVELAKFHGWCGHFHVVSLEKQFPKCDPGPLVLPTLASMWDEPRTYVEVEVGVEEDSEVDSDDSDEFLSNT